MEKVSRGRDNITYDPVGAKHLVVYRKESNATLTLGRKDCDLEFPDDKSISRQHCKVHFEWSDGTANVVVEDNGSKFGTYLANLGRISGRHIVNLGISGIIVTFGMQNAGIRLRSAYVSTSGVAASDLYRIKSTLNHCGISCVDSVDRISGSFALLMPQMKLTSKAVSALYNGIPIVRPEFITRIHDLIMRDQSLKIIPLTDDLHDLVPPFGEATLQSPENKSSLLPHSERRSLFQSVAFLAFCKEQHARLCALIEGGDGKIILAPTELSPVSDNETHCFIIKATAGAERDIHLVYSELLRL